MRAYSWMACFLFGGVAALSGCGAIHNNFRETGPATTEDWDSPTGLDIATRIQPAELRGRGWKEIAFVGERGTVIHGPTYFEDPFVDKGAGRQDSGAGKHPHNKYYIGWEDGVALVYSPARFALNLAGFPVSIVVTPPWTPMESDGEISKQILGRDHDAIPQAQAQRERADHGRESEVGKGQ